MTVWPTQTTACFSCSVLYNNVCSSTPVCCTLSAFPRRIHSWAHTISHGWLDCRLFHTTGSGKYNFGCRALSPFFLKASQIVHVVPASGPPYYAGQFTQEYVAMLHYCFLDLNIQIPFLSVSEPFSACSEVSWDIPTRGQAVEHCSALIRLLHSMWFYSRCCWNDTRNQWYIYIYNA